MENRHHYYAATNLCTPQPQGTNEFSKSTRIHNPSMTKRTLDTLRNYLCDYTPPVGSVHRINMLLFGMVGAGKSSVINTFLSALDAQGRTINCIPTGMNPASLTPELRSYRHGKLCFWDSAGWNSLDNPDRTKKILQMILEGRVRHGTELQSFNPDLNVAKYPVIRENVIHGVAFIFDVTTIDEISESVMKLFQELQTIVAQKYIYRVVIGTMFDRMVIKEQHHDRIYEYRPLQEKFARLSHFTGIDQRCIFVMSNQWKGDRVEKTKSILALYVLDNMVRNIDRFLKISCNG